jgi:GNAT superfamily N-acetyltransferase
MDVVVEIAGRDQVGRLLEIRRAAFSAAAPAAYSPREVETLLGDVDPGEMRRMADDRRLFVGLAGGVVAGCAGWQEERLRHVYVDPAFMRRGIAGRLLRRVEADFRERTGAREIRAGVALHALPFYLAVGYTVVRYARAWDGSSYAETVKALDPVTPPGCPASG